jgi:hypothetical protein
MEMLEDVCKIFVRKENIKSREDNARPFSMHVLYENAIFILS